MKIDIDLNEKSRKTIAKGLSKLLADTYTLYLKTHNFHWNVTGPMFSSLHKMFEDQYVALAEAVDEIAERIRSLGFPAPGSYAEFAKLTDIEEESGVPKTEEMIKQLVNGNECVIRSARSLVEYVSNAHDEGSADLIIKRMEYHEKTAWMLRSLVE